MTITNFEEEVLALLRDISSRLTLSGEGGGGSVTPADVASGIDASTDIEALKTVLDLIRSEIFDLSAGVQGREYSGEALAAGGLLVGGRTSGGSFQALLTDSGGRIEINPPTGTSSTRVQGVVADGGLTSGNPVQVAGKDSVGFVQSLLTDSSGRLHVTGQTGSAANQTQGTTADGALAVGNPVQTAGRDGSGNVRSLLTDSSGRLQTVVNDSPTGVDSNQIQGTAAPGTSFIGNPVFVGGRDSSGYVRALFTDTLGRLYVTGPTGLAADQVQGTAAAGAASAGNPVQVGGRDGTANIRPFLTDSSGRLEVVNRTGTSATQIQGIAAYNATPSGNPVYVAGVHAATNQIKGLATDSAGRVLIATDPAAGTVVYPVPQLPVLSTTASVEYSSVDAFTRKFVVPASTRWEIISLRFVCNLSTQTGTRHLYIAARASALGSFFQQVRTADITGSSSAQTVTVFASRGATPYSLSNTFSLVLPELYLVAGEEIVFGIAAAQSSDTIDATLLLRYRPLTS